MHGGEVATGGLKGPPHRPSATRRRRAAVTGLATEPTQAARACHRCRSTASARDQPRRRPLWNRAHTAGSSPCYLGAPGPRWLLSSANHRLAPSHRPRPTTSPKATFTIFWAITGASGDAPAPRAPARARQVCTWGETHKSRWSRQHPRHHHPLSSRRLRSENGRTSRPLRSQANGHTPYRSHHQGTPHSRRRRLLTTTNHWDRTTLRDLRPRTYRSHRQGTPHPCRRRLPTTTNH